MPGETLRLDCLILKEKKDNLPDCHYKLANDKKGFL